MSFKPAPSYVECSTMQAGSSMELLQVLARGSICLLKNTLQFDFVPVSLVYELVPIQLLCTTHESHLTCFVLLQ